MRTKRQVLADNRQRPTDRRDSTTVRFPKFGMPLSVVVAFVCLLSSAHLLTASSLAPISGTSSEQTPSTEATPSPTPQNRAPQLDPNASPEQLETEGDKLRSQKLFADALDRYHLALRKGRDTARLHNKIGITEMRLQHYDQSRKEFERAVKRDKNYAEAWNNLGAMEYFRQNYRRAISNYQHAIKIEPNSAIYHSNLASAYFNRKDVEKAVAEYTLALKLDPTIFEHYASSGNSIQPLVSTQNRAEYDYTIAKIFAKSGDLDHCLDYLKKAMEEDGGILGRIKKDEEFSPLRQNPRFVALLNNPPTPLPR